jgi:gliding motility-associated protein GldE
LETDTLLTPSQSGIWSAQFMPVTTYVVFSLIVVLLLLIISALVSGSEVAYFSLNATDKQKLKKKSKINNQVLKNLESPEKLLATILVTNNFVNIGIIILTANITNNLITIINAPVIEFILQVVLISFLLLIFGEILPKLYATHFLLGFARFMAIPLQLLEKICRPVNTLLIASTSFVNHRLQKHHKNVSIDEISQALKLTSNQELSEEKEMLEGIVKFGNKNVAEIMNPRVDVVSLDIKTSFSTVLNLIVDSGFSRIPVYVGSFDNIKGILYIKDILPHSHKNDSFNWQTLIRPPFYVPETKKINSLLKEFQKNKVHLAVVIDEYGGTSGIVTLEDVLEEIVGEIVDEFDEEENFFTQISENVFLFDGKTLLGDFFKISKCDDNVFNSIKGEAETLAGLILEIKGEIPEIHEKIEYKQFIFTIEAVDKRRIKQIKIEII